MELGMKTFSITILFLIIIGIIIAIVLSSGSAGGSPTLFDTKLSSNSFSLSFQSSSDSDINQVTQKCKEIMDSVISSEHTNNISLSFQDLGNTTAGVAYYYQKKIILNTRLSNYTYLNDMYVSEKVPILIHEILHILGIGTGSGWNNNVTNYYYTGTNGVLQYKSLLEELSYPYSDDIIKVPIENNFGSGTQNSHFEEGLKGDSFQTSTSESRVDNGVCYPHFQKEMMTGLLQTDRTVLTKMTLGVLEDLGYTVNYNSPYISSAITYSL